MYISQFDLVLIAVTIWVHFWLKDTSSPAYKEWRRKKRVWKAEDRLQLKRNRAANRELMHRYCVVGRRYFRASFWQYLEFVWVFHAIRTDVARNRYVTLAEMYWATQAPKAPGDPALLAHTSADAPALPAH